MSLDLLLQQLTERSRLSWRDETYDLALASNLSASELATYVAGLLEQAHEGDGIAMLTLAHLNVTEAIPMLVAFGKRSESVGATIARRALIVLGNGADVITEIAHDAVSSDDKMERFAAVLDLPKVGGPTAIFALRQALLDEDSDVRVVAWDGLIEALGLTKRLQNPEGVRELTTEVEVMRVLLGCELLAVAKVGASAMREVVRRLAAGTMPQQLGIAWRPRVSQPVFEKLRDAVFDTSIPFPLDEIATMRGTERQLAEAMIARQLQDWDARTPDALVELRATWLAASLAELAESKGAPDELREKLADAARELAK